MALRHRRGSSWVLITALAIVFAGGSAVEGDDRPGTKLAAAPIYTRENAPRTPKLEDLPLKESVSQYGITWTFDKPARAGQFINGEWYVVGPVTIKSIDPKPLVGKEVPEDDTDPEEQKERADGQFTRNGSVLNPPPVMGKTGFDSRVRHHTFDPLLTARLPIAMKPGDALMSAASVPLKKTKHYSPIAELAVLTCLREPAPPDAFRPGLLDRQQTIYLARNLKRELLPTLEPVGTEPRKSLLTPAQLTEHFIRPWQVLNVFKEDHSAYQWEGYGQRSCYYMGEALLYLCLKAPAGEKEPLLDAVIGQGIDYWAVVKSGHPGFPAWGGWNSGYKMPIVLAGVLLGDDTMASPSKAYPKCSFQEDEQTAYGPAWNGANVVFCGHSGYDAATLKSRVRGSNAWGFYEHMHPSMWNKDQVQSDGYRRCCTSRTWQAEALVGRLMKLEKYWAHDAFFDYMDRWMYQPETDEVWKAVKDANVRVGWKPNGEWARQGNVEDPFAEAMWAKYRTAPGMPATDGWKTLKANENGLVMPAAKLAPDGKGASQ